MSEQELLDKVYEEFTDEVQNLKIDARTTAIAVVGELTRALKRVVNKHGATAITVNGKKYTAEEADEAGI